MDNIKIIAHIKSDFKEKFGIPRQSGLSSSVARIVFEKEYRNDDALRGIEGYSHLWLLWKFSKSERDSWSPTVRPPRLGGNKRVGVFATRSPFRPNPIGLSSVELLGIEKSDEGTVLVIKGADLLNGTPIYDIKPYLAFTDSHPDAKGGFSDEKLLYNLNVSFPDELAKKVCEEKREVLKEILSQDPRPSYIEDEKRIYGFEFDVYEIKFSVKGDTLFVVSVEEKK
jgi:tRNA-Thr(GGU) m(6)t(6)A37 methyltransferase TsaA